jgi:hypothetical protein
MSGSSLRSASEVSSRASMASVVTRNPANDGHLKSGQRKPLLKTSPLESETSSLATSFRVFPSPISMA